MISLSRRAQIKIQSTTSEIEDVRRICTYRGKAQDDNQGNRTVRKKTDVQVLERDVNLIETLNFVSKKELKALVMDALDAATRQDNSSEAARKVLKG